MLTCPVCAVMLYETDGAHNDRNHSCSECGCRFDIGNRRGLVPGMIIRLHKIVSEGRASYEAFDIVFEAIIIASKKRYEPVFKGNAPQPDVFCRELINLAVLWYGSEAGNQLKAMNIHNATDLVRLIKLLIEGGVLEDTGDSDYFKAFTDETDFEQLIKHKISTMYGACKRCGYDLRANASGACPECGELVVAAGKTA